MVPLLLALSAPRSRPGLLPASITGKSAPVARFQDRQFPARNTRRRASRAARLDWLTRRACRTAGCRPGSTPAPAVRSTSTTNSGKPPPRGRWPRPPPSHATTGSGRRRPGDSRVAHPDPRRERHPHPDRAGRQVQPGCVRRQRYYWPSRPSRPTPLAAGGRRAGGISPHPGAAGRRRGLRRRPDHGGQGRADGHPRPRPPGALAHRPDVPPILAYYRSALRHRFAPELATGLLPGAAGARRQRPPSSSWPTACATSRRRSPRPAPSPSPAPPAQTGEISRFVRYQRAAQLRPWPRPAPSSTNRVLDGLPAGRRPPTASSGASPWPRPTHRPTGPGRRVGTGPPAVPWPAGRKGNKP